MKQPNLFELPGAQEPAGDEAARAFAVDPESHVVLEASAGTGKTKVLVDRYVGLIQKGVDPLNILAVTFTRKAAAEMRDRVLAELRRRAAAGAIKPEAWKALQDRIADVQISTIDAFCFGLLREFALEAGVDPGFDVADETEMGRFGREATDLALRAARGLLASDESLQLLLARVKMPVLSRTIAEMLDRRHIALPAVAEFVRRRSADVNPEDAAAAFIRGLETALAHSPHRRALLDQGPMGSAEYRWLRQDLTSLDAFRIPEDLRRLQHLRRRAERYFLTLAGEPRRKTPGTVRAEDFKSKADKKAHDEAVMALAPLVAAELTDLETRINAVLARGLNRLLVIASSIYERLLDEHALLDFAGMLDRSVQLLERQEEFARSRLKLQGRYHHVLVDEFQDTSRLQWRLIDLLVESWGEGEGVTDAPTSIFIVGDRKQSIYRFRHAEVTLLEVAARRIQALRPSRPVRQALTTSFRAVPELLAFVNALSEAIESESEIPERFRYTDTDRFPTPEIGAGALRDGAPVLGIIAESSLAACASAVALEVERILAGVVVRTREGPPRPAKPDDIAILFRSRAGHQYFETALEERGIRTYVYKGLGFFDAPEVQDLQALMRFFAQPDSDLRAAEFLRSRFIRLSDPAIVKLAPHFAAALTGPPSRTASADAAPVELDPSDRALLDLARRDVPRWLALLDRVTPGELVDTVLRESFYFHELRGRRFDQARENVKKVRGLIRRVESRGYATLARIAEYFETLRAGDESNAIIEAAGAVNLMTMHAAKGLEFPIVFLVNLHMQGRGRSGNISIIERGVGDEPEVAFSSTDGTRLEDLRESEELRRLMYVGATRARDRLYLAAELDQRGHMRRGGRSLASLLPKSLQDVFGNTVAARAAGDQVTWASTRGPFTFEICRPGDPPAVQVEDDTGGAFADLPWLVPAHRTSRPTAIANSSTPQVPAASAGRLVGTLVHRLLQRQLPAGTREPALRALANQLVRRDERADNAGVAELADEAVALYVRLRDRDDLRTALSSGEVHFEVPFSHTLEDRPDETIRGVIDCLIIPADGPPIVLEFKTGRPTPDHDAQVALYRDAARQLLGVSHVDTRILYA